MEKTTEKRVKMFNQLIRPDLKIPETDTRSVTVPSSTLTVRQIKERFANGFQAVGQMQENFFDDGKSNGRDMASMDFHDLKTLQNEMFAKAEFLKKRSEAEHAAKLEYHEKMVKAKRDAFTEEVKKYAENFLKEGNSSINRP